jgi:hypothetical protein
MPKPDSAYEKLAPALDRFHEAHFWIHMLEQYYHSADPFRWHLNAFLKSTKEVPQLIKMALQNEAGFKAWYADHAQRLQDDPLLELLSKHRDFVVHRGMLQLSSRGTLGITEGRGIKLGLSIPVHPLEDSDAAMERYLRVVAKNGDTFGFLAEDEDSLPCVQREWRLPQLESEIVEASAAAWLRLGNTISDVLRWLGADPPPLSLDCRHSSQQVQFKLFSRDKLRMRLAEIKKGHRKGRSRQRKPASKQKPK